MWNKGLKRAFDLMAGIVGFVLLLPVIAAFLFLIYLGDRHWPLYSPERRGKNNAPFRMHKMRSMVIGADKTKMDTTSATDSRITPVGAFIRRFKIDEFPQFINIIKGEMSFVGPRPQIDREVALYTEAEKKLLTARPGVTDISSIIFADLGDIMAAHDDPNIAYNQLVRPWKSRLGLFYIDHSSFWLDIWLILMTVLCVVSKTRARRGIVWALTRLDAPADLVALCRRDAPLVPTPPPGSDQIVQSRAPADLH